MAMMKETSKWDKVLDPVPTILLSIIGILSWVVILNYAFTVSPAINGFYAIVAGALLTIGVAATLPKRGK